MLDILALVSYKDKGPQSVRAWNNEPSFMPLKVFELLMWDKVQYHGANGSTPVNEMI